VNLRSLDTGFVPDDVLVLMLDARAACGEDLTKHLALYERLVRQVAAVSGVRSASPPLDANARRRRCWYSMQRVHLSPGKALCRFCGELIAMNRLSTHIAKAHPRPARVDTSPSLVRKRPATAKRRPKSPTRG
jgi:hypothetical protein